MKISKIFAAILLCLLVIAATSAYLAGRSRDAQEAAAIQEGTDVSGNSEDFAETEGGAEGEGDIDAPETSAQEAAETEQTTMTAIFRPITILSAAAAAVSMIWIFRKCVN